MKRFLFFVTALLFLGTAVAADKVIQSSAKRAPGWIGGMGEDYFIVSAEAPTLDEAQQKAMNRVREEIIAAIATQVHSATSITIREVTENGVIDSHKDVQSEVSVKAADIPYLASISPSLASDYYWVKVRRSDKSVYYVYHVLYPLSASKLRMLVDEYDQQQKQINDSLQAFASVNMANMDDLNKMLMQYTALSRFEAGLHEDDSRHAICKTIRAGYDKMLAGNLHIETVASDRGQTTVALMYGPKRIQYTVVPKVKSNCMTAIQTKSEGDATRISYDFETGCYDDDQNWLDVTFTVNSKKITTRCYIK